MPALVRKLPGPAQPTDLPAEPTVATTGLVFTVAAPEASADPPAAGQTTPAHRGVVAPLAPERYRVQFTVGREIHEKLRRVQDLLRREIPDGDPGAIFDRACAHNVHEAELVFGPCAPTRPGASWTVAHLTPLLLETRGT